MPDFQSLHLYKMGVLCTISHFQECLQPGLLLLLLLLLLVPQSPDASILDEGIYKAIEKDENYVIVPVYHQR